MSDVFDIFDFLLENNPDDKGYSSSLEVCVDDLGVSPSDDDDGSAESVGDYNEVIEVSDESDIEVIEISDQSDIEVGEVISDDD